MNRTFDVFTSWSASVLRFGAGMYTQREKGPRPAKLLELYEFEACPFCRKVREALSELDLPAIIRPCGKGSPHRAYVIEHGGKAQFPYLVDPNTGTEMYESMEIIRYLRAHYGDGRRGFYLGPISTLGGSLASGLRVGRGRRARPARAPEQLLKLWSFEASPYCRIVRERLTELSIPYHLVNIGKHSAERNEFRAKHGRIQVPYLEDPNTGAAMFESADIAAYLERTYALQ
jgi:glutathione S-transferase